MKTRRFLFSGGGTIKKFFMKKFLPDFEFIIITMITLSALYLFVHTLPDNIYKKINAVLPL